MRLLFTLVALLGALIAAPAMAGDKEIAALTAVFAPGPTDMGLFNQDFLTALPPDKLEAILAPIKTTIGPVVGIEPQGGQSYAVETATYEMMADIGLDENGKIAGLLVHPPVEKSASIEDLLKQLSAIAPQAAYLVTKDGASLYAGDADTALAVGSAFKLGVLKALRDEIGAGTRKWSDVVTLTDGDMSLPSGFLQTWPVGSPLTLHTLAALMISISDNTAADTLLKLVGRDKVEAALGIEVAITTRELFALKADPELAAKYVAAADAAAKHAVLDEVDKLPRPDFSKGLTPLTAGIEWYLSPAKLCALIGEVGDLDVTRINPGVANPAEWSTIAFKGGSEIGVLSFTSLLKSKSGATYCVSAVWNGPAAIDEGKAGSAYAGVLSKLAKG